MKRNLFLGIVVLFICLLIVTGCGKNSEGSGNGGGLLNSNKTMTCTKEEVDSEGFKTSETMEITYNTSKVLKIKSTSVIDTDPEYIDMQITIGGAFAEKLSEVDGITMKYEKASDKQLKLSYVVEYDKVKPEQIKEKLGDLYDEDSASIYSAKNYTIDDFKRDNLDGYTCK